MKSIDLAGKNIIWLGSSVTYGAASGGIAMPELVAERTGCISFKYAVGGTTLSTARPNNYIERMHLIPADIKCDFFIFQLSTNDATQNLPLGEISRSYDRSSFITDTTIGAVEYICAYVREVWGCPCGIYINPSYPSAAYDDMASAIPDISKKWGLYVLDFRNENKVGDIKPYMFDDIHPNLRGYSEWWTPVFAEFIASVIKP